MAGLTKQHFEEIAKIINEVIRSGSIDKDIMLTDRLSDYFKTQNPLFNENRFKKACLE